jgi:hypothetical protein
LTDRDRLLHHPHAVIEVVFDGAGDRLVQSQRLVQDRDILSRHFSVDGELQLLFSDTERLGLDRASGEYGTGNND